MATGRALAAFADLSGCNHAMTGQAFLFQMPEGGDELRKQRLLAWR